MLAIEWLAVGGVVLLVVLLIDGEQALETSTSARAAEIAVGIPEAGE